MLIGTAVVTAHLMMADCPTDKPDDPSCIYVVSMDLYGPARHSMPLCELNANFLNPNIKQQKGRLLEMRCWTPEELRRQKTVL